MADESLKPEGDMPFDGKRMFWGGFEPIVDTADARERRSPPDRSSTIQRKEIGPCPTYMTRPSRRQRRTRDTAHGDFIWYELMTPDPDGAKAFYDAVVGWTIGEPVASSERLSHDRPSDGGMPAGSCR